MSSGSGKIFIKVETSLEQQENLKNSRRNLKIIQRTATDKENLVGRSPVIVKGGFTKSKSETQIVENEVDAKRKKLVSHASQTDSELKQALDHITEEDLTSENEPSEAYWKVLAEKRRVALDISLKENEELHDRISVLEEELNVSRTMLDETKNLVEILTEMLDDKDNGTTEQSTSQIGECSTSKDLLNASLAEEATETLVTTTSTFVEEKLKQDFTTPIKYLDPINEES